MKCKKLLILMIVACMVLYGTVSTALAAEPMERSETVYVKADAYGTPTAIISSVYLTNPDKLAFVTDQTSLTDVRHITGTKPPSVNGTEYTFQADGDDVSYQGNADLPLPLEMNVSYMLDGQPITAEALAGKSGHVKISVSFVNHALQDVLINDETVPLYTPFTVVSILQLNEGFTNITCENAKLLNEAGTTSVSGVLFPGLSENLDQSAEGMLSDAFSLEADVTAFELDSMTAVAVTGIIDAQDVKDLDDLQQLIDGVDAMDSAGSALSKGTRQLNQGAAEFRDGLVSYTDGVKSLEGGLASTAQGSGELLNGMRELSDGTSSLAYGVDQMVWSIEELMIDLKSGTLSPEMMDVLKNTFKRAISSLVLEEIQGTELEGVITEELISCAIDQTFDLECTQQITQAFGSAFVDSISSKLDLLDYFQSGTRELADGMKEATTGMETLDSGLNDLHIGSKTLSSNSGELIDGFDQIVSGIRSLNQGVNRLNKDGIQELVTNTQKVSVVMDRKDAMIELGKNYKSYSGLQEYELGTVKFVITTESIFEPKPLEPTPDSEPTTAEPEQEPGFFERIWIWIKSLFGG